VHLFLFHCLTFFFNSCASFDIHLVTLIFVYSTNKYENFDSECTGVNLFSSADFLYYY
jgi:hypothetical protein